jgi:hypothetical protein
MKTTFFNEMDISKKKIIIPVLFGIVGSITFVLLPLLANVLIIDRFWQLVINYNDGFREITYIQNYALFIVGSLIIGIAVCKQLGSSVSPVKDAIRAGILSGLVSGFILSCGIVIYIWLSSPNPLNEISIPMLGFLGSGYGTSTSPPEPLFINLIILNCVIFFVASIGLQTFGGYFSYTLQKNAGKPIFSLTNQKIGKFLSRNLSTILCILLVFIIVVPAGITYAEMRMNLIDPTFGCCGLTPNSAIPERINSNTIQITYLTTSEINLGKENPFVDPIPGLDRPRLFIYYNSHDLSDQVIINKQGLAVSIDPPEGLHYVRGSTVLLKGNEISNISGPGHLKVIDVNPSRGRDMNWTVEDWEI